MFALQYLNILLFIAVTALRSLSSQSLVIQQSILSPTPVEMHRVVRIIDGDTIEIENNQRIRYIGINSPEMKAKGKPDQCFAQEAKKKNEELVLNKAVRLEKDISNIDTYNRLLRFVYVQQPNGKELFVNEYLVQEGFAQLMTIPPDISKADIFKKLQASARDDKKGLWGICK